MEDEASTKDNDEDGANSWSAPDDSHTKCVRHFLGWWQEREHILIRGLSLPVTTSFVK